MKFTTPNAGKEFDIPDEWWEFSEMTFFQPNSGGFYYCDHFKNNIQVVSLTEIEPPVRNEGIPLLKKEKLVPILFAFRLQENPLPPVEVHRLTTPSLYKFRIHNGYHRFYASVAVGYTMLPIVVVEPYEP